MTKPVDMARIALWWARSHSFIDPDQQLNNCWLITGSGRSGTTWLQELIAASGGLRPVFEPFHAQKSPGFRDLPFDMYVAPGDDSHEELSRRVSAVLRGKYRSRWSDRMNKLSRPRIYRGRVVKEIRITPLTAWIVDRNPGVHAVHLIRNPYDVAASAGAVGWNSQRFDHLFSQIEDFADVLSNYQIPKVEGCTAAQRFMLGWTIENSLAFEMLPSRSVKLAVYGELTASDDAILDLLRRLGLPHEQVPATVRRPSKTTRADSHIQGKRRAQLDPESRGQVAEILNAFGFDSAFDEDGTTHPEILHARWGSSHVV